MWTVAHNWSSAARNVFESCKSAELAATRLQSALVLALECCSRAVTCSTGPENICGGQARLNLLYLMVLMAFQHTGFPVTVEERYGGMVIDYLYSCRVLTHHTN
jgi:hypothetical protein